MPGIKRDREVAHKATSLSLSYGRIYRCYLLDASDEDAFLDDRVVAALELPAGELLFTAERWGLVLPEVTAAGFELVADFVSVGLELTAELRAGWVAVDLVTVVG